MRNQKTPLAEDLCVHIFSVSAAMLGVCITVIGLIRVVNAFQKIDTIADDIVAIDSLFFLSSCLLSYWALRTRDQNRMHKVERVADALFIIGLSFLSIASFIITYSVAFA